MQQARENTKDSCNNQDGKRTGLANRIINATRRRKKGVGSIHGKKRPQCKAKLVEPRKIRKFTGDLENLKKF
jgi:ribosomal protein L19E